MDIKGIKCDKVGCGYNDDSVESKNYVAYINKPCPQCGSNLLTEADYTAFKSAERLFNNPVFKGLNKFLSIFSKPKTYLVNMNGTGKVTLKEQK